jgi:ubiquinone/menaquinone biosynthesis C-methylase UbiE
MTRKPPGCYPRTNPPDPVRFALWLICLLLITPLQAQEQSVNPGINRNYDHPDWQQWVQTFETPRREVYARRQAIVAASDVRPGMNVADIGAGTGLFTRLFAPIVAPTGNVYAVDISETFSETGLPDDSIDLAFVTNTYHHFEYPQSMLASIRRALHRDGRLIVIDFRRDPRVSSPWVMGHVRANRDTVVREIQAAGFRLVADKPVLRSNYFLVFKKTRP